VSRSWNIGNDEHKRFEFVLDLERHDDSGALVGEANDILETICQDPPHSAQDVEWAKDLCEVAGVNPFGDGAAHGDKGEAEATGVYQGQAAVERAIKVLRDQAEWNYQRSLIRHRITALNSEVYDRRDGNRTRTTTGQESNVKPAGGWNAMPNGPAGPEVVG